MTSLIDTTKPSGPVAYTSDVRGNFASAKSEIEALQYRAADVANVLNFGADPTGVFDSAPAINAAAAVLASGSTRHKAVYLPTGTYRVNSQINLTACQAFYGDSRGSSVLMVDQAFDPAATAVIYVTAASYDAGPVLRDFGITFQQPQDQGSRANFKTLAAGGTSGPGGTGVMYPPAIASGSESFRIQCIRLRIGGAWDGITTNGHNTVFWLDDIEMGALNCGVNMGDGPGVQDFCHINHYHFWTFEIGGTALQNVYYDGQVISLRVGRCDGLNITGFCSFAARLVFTGDGGYTGCHIANAMFDGDQATLEILGTGIGHLWISNAYASAGVTGRIRPWLTMSGGGHVKIDNFYSHSSAAHPDFLLSHDAADLTLSNFHCNFYTLDQNWAQIQRGTMRILNGRLALPNARTVPAIAETLAGILVIDNLQLDDAGTGGAGVVLSMVTANPSTMIGAIAFTTGAAWTVSLPAGLSQQFRTPVQITTPTMATTAQLALFNAGNTNGLESKLRFYGTFPAGGDFGEYLAASLRGGWSATAWDGSYLDVWLTNTGNSNASDANMVQVARFASVGATLAGTLRAGALFTDGTIQAGSTGGSGVGLGLVGAAGTQKALLFYRGGSIGWAMATEGAGDNLGVQRYDDAQTYQGDAIQISRATGVVTFQQPIVNGSDRSLKTNIEPVTGALEIVSKLQGVFYNHRDAPRRQLGLIAQDVLVPLPEVVFDVGPEVGPDGVALNAAAPNLLGVAYPNIVAVLIEAVKELAAVVAGKPA